MCVDDRLFEQHMLNLTFFSRAFGARFRLASFQLGLLLTTAQQLSNRTRFKGPETSAAVVFPASRNKKEVSGVIVLW